MAKKTKKLVGRTTPRKLSAEGKPFKGRFAAVNRQGLNAWNTGRTMKYHGVKVGGKSYSSCWEAFQKLKLGTAGQCKKFRKGLKAEGRGTFGDKKFTAIAA